MNYFAIYYNSILLILLASLIGIRPSPRRNQVVEVPSYILGFLLIPFIAWVLGSEPFVIGSWSDRGCYAQGVVDAQRLGLKATLSSREFAFSIYTYLVSLVTNPQGWFYITALIYVGNLLLVSWRLTRSYSYVLFLSFLVAFQFYNYGTNTIRAGFAATVVLLGLSFCNNFKTMMLCFCIAMFSHKSMVVPIVALAMSYKFPKTKFYLYVWLASIVVSYFGGSFLQNYVAGLTDDTRADYITTGDVYYKSMFRWDFLAYSALPVFLGWYYINKLYFKSEFYRWVYNAYLIANAFWIMVIRAAYSDRFAYLSWFMFPIILMYPLLTQQLYRDCNKQQQNIVIVLLGQIVFSYYMFWAYNGHTIF